jgi:hypothetical protein
MTTESDPMGPIDIRVEGSIDVALEGAREELVKGQSMDVRVTTDPPPGNAAEYIYAWYLNGIPLDEEDKPEITVGVDLDRGNYRLDASVFYNEMASSAHCNFVVR